MSNTPYARSERSTLRRIPERGSHERATIDAILDEGLIAHIGFETPDGPVVIPTIYARVGETLYLHGSPASRMLRALAKGPRVCLSVTHIDGLVLARSAFHHSMNYRSVVAFGCARVVEEPQEKLAALRAVVEHVVPGRSEDARGPNDFEFKYTLVLALEIEEATAKLRTGGPNDDEGDLTLPCWAGLVPLRVEAGTPVRAANLAQDTPVPGYASRYRRP